MGHFRKLSKIKKKNLLRYFFLFCLSIISFCSLCCATKIMSCIISTHSSEQMIVGFFFFSYKGICLSFKLSKVEKSLNYLNCVFILTVHHLYPLKPSMTFWLKKKKKKKAFVMKSLSILYIGSHHWLIYSSSSWWACLLDFWAVSILG